MIPPPVPSPFAPAVAEPQAPARAALRLSASRGRLSLELQEPFELGPFRITQLVSSLVGLRFPVDLSGGVARFRHRRGSLEALSIEASLPRLAESLRPRVRQVLDAPLMQLSLIPNYQGLTVGLHDDQKALAFSLLFAPEHETLQWVVTEARAYGYSEHAHALALRLVQALVGKHGRRAGSLLILERAAFQLVREVLVDAGARAPDAKPLRYTGWEQIPEGVRLTAQSEAAPWVASMAVLRTVELARIAEAADDALAQGDYPKAREALLMAQERAPRQPDLALRLAELDLFAGHAPEAALASLVESVPAVDGGLVAARLLAALGDTQAAAVAARRAAETETYAPLAAFLFCTAAQYVPSAAEKMALLDEAVARAPTLQTARWERAHTRLRVGDLSRAVADFGQLEAACHGAQQRFDVCLRAARLLLDQRMGAQATRFFERALRYLPTSIEASAGLARAFLSLGDRARGISLLSRAVALTKRTENASPALVLELATTLADVAQDLPTAIAHARSIPFGVAQTVAARALEGRWRGMLGDLEGASHAFGEAREAAELFPQTTTTESAEWFAEAARFERDQHNEPRAALRQAELALRLSPRSPSLQSLFRQLAEQVSASAASRAPEPLPPPEPPVQAQEPELPVTEPSPVPPPVARDQLDLEPAEPESDAQDEARIGMLTEQVRANPQNQAVVLELCELLQRRDRPLELFALVSGQLEDMPQSEHRGQLLLYRREALRTLASQAREQGRTEEAEVYEIALAEEEPG